ncbi:DUF6879 family protein [Streptomyces sp. URMC 129]|uniref:DUF6879 family protein n=1 Tax=Streptomyces sp. URMC 129 TaxID=3423407 RepID=UPI003F1DDC47
MGLRFLGTTSEGGNCPTLYEIEETGEIVAQGERVTDPKHLAQLKDVKDSETFVVLPRELLIRFAPREARMPELIPFEEASHLFTAFEHTAWRLETQRGYASDRQSPRFERFLRGEPIGAYDPESPWHVSVREQTRQGKRFERVRLVDDPPTEGQRFLLAGGLGNVEAGEDIRNMYRADAVRLGLPDDDFWLFDSRVIMKFVIDGEGVTLGVELVEDPAEVLRACQVRDLAWHYAVPTAEFQKQVRSHE